MFLGRYSGRSVRSVPSALWCGFRSALVAVSFCFCLVCTLVLPSATTEPVAEVQHYVYSSKVRVS